MHDPLLQELGVLLISCGRDQYTMDDLEVREMKAERKPCYGDCPSVLFFCDRFLLYNRKKIEKKGTLYTFMS